MKSPQKKDQKEDIHAVENFRGLQSTADEQQESRSSSAADGFHAETEQGASTPAGTRNQRPEHLETGGLRPQRLYRPLVFGLNLDSGTG